MKKASNSEFWTRSRRCDWLKSAVWTWSRWLPDARPPVCRIMDYGKFKYEQSKKARKARQASHTVKVKTIQFRPKTDDHDYEFKKKHIISFLEAGNKVKVVMRFRGREMSHMDLGPGVPEEPDRGDRRSTAARIPAPARRAAQISFVMAPKKT